MFWLILYRKRVGLVLKIGLFRVVLLNIWFFRDIVGFEWRRSVEEDGFYTVQV